MRKRSPIVAFRRERVKTRRIALARNAGCRKSRTVFTDDLLELQGLTPLAKGNVRLVFAYPGRPEMVVKVMRPDPPLARKEGGGHWLSGLRRYDPYLVFLREVREFICGCTAGGAPLDFVQKVRGLVETDMGLGLVTDAALDGEGRLAPTIARLIGEGKFDGPVEAAFEDFVSKLLECDLVLSDLHERNLVLAVGKDGKESFQLIDGLGSSSLIPFKNWSPSMNRRSKEKRIARLRKRMARRLEAFRAGNPP